MPEHPPAPHHLVEEGARLERVATGATWAEGPVGLPRRRAVRFSDIHTNRILEYSEETGELTVVSDDAEYTNGRTLDLDGHVVECSHGRRAVQRDTAVGPGDAHRPITLVERFGRARLNSPNDVVVASDGAIWFTDPAYGIKRPVEGHAGDEEYGDRYVFRYDEKADALTPVVIDVEAPNGLAFSPDESLLYVADSSLSPADPDTTDTARPRGHSIHVYDVVEGRHAKNGRPLVEVSPGLPDGIRSTWKDGSGARACPACRCSPRTASACWTSPCPRRPRTCASAGTTAAPSTSRRPRAVPDPHHHDGCQHGRTGQGEPLTGRLGPSRNSWGAWRPWGISPRSTSAARAAPRG